jgi:hypothetical protein
VSIGGYFVTEEAKKAKNWDMVQQQIEAKANIARLGNELEGFARSWADLAEACNVWEDNTFIVSDTRIQVKRPARVASERNECCSNMVADVESKHFDLEYIRKLLSDLEASKKHQTKLASQLKDIGVA